MLAGLTLVPVHVSYLLVLQLLETFFTLVTLNICDPAPPLVDEPALALEPAEPAPLEPEAVPLTSTSLFTCEASFDVSPWS